MPATDVAWEGNRSKPKAQSNPSQGDNDLGTHHDTAVPSTDPSLQEQAKANAEAPPKKRCDGSRYARTDLQHHQRNRVPRAVLRIRMGTTFKRKRSVWQREETDPNNGADASLMVEEYAETMLQANRKRTV